MTDPRESVLPRGRDAQSGLTLVEVLVSLAIVGVMAGLVTLGTGRIAAPDLARTEAERLARVLEALSDAALVSGVDRVLSVGAGRYQADQQEPRQLPPGVTISQTLTQTDAAGPSIRLSGHGDAAPATLELADGATVWTVSFDGLRARVVAGRANGRGGRP